MSFKIVSDSSSNVLEFPGIDFESVPLKIITAKKEYVDDENLDIEAMVEEIRETKGKSGTSCPNIGDWLRAFGEAENIFAITITSKLSGSYASAVEAAKIYEVSLRRPGKAGAAAGCGLLPAFARLAQ